MNNFQIETAQNIRITQRAAGILERILAYLIDLSIIIAYLIVAFVLAGGLNGTAGGEWLFLSVILLPVFLYFFLWEIFWNGQTPGKAALNIRVVKLDGSKPAFSNYVVRWLLRMVDITITSGSVAVVTILLNGKGQRLGDLAAGTTVISESRQVGLEQTLLVEVPQNYEPQYPQVTVLTDEDVQEIKQVYQEALQESNYKVIKALSIKVSELLKADPTENASQFIETVLKDYSYYTQQ